MSKKEDIARLLGEGFNQRVIAEKVGVSQPYVAKVKREISTGLSAKGKKIAKLHSIAKSAEKDAYNQAAESLADILREVVDLAAQVQRKILRDFLEDTERSDTKAAAATSRDVLVQAGAKFGDQTDEERDLFLYDDAEPENEQRAAGGVA